MKPLYIFECSSCRQKKEIKKFFRGLKYCEDCKHRVPTRMQYKQYIASNGQNDMVDWRHEGRAKLA
jgi:hypothetical protein